ncbi:MAG: hypothetical protein MK052_03915 [Alphaproteobacteria bacterium]|nr:hypothetical protein [Alphaproteobacteria bacterium]
MNDKELALAETIRSKLESQNKLDLSEININQWNFVCVVPETSIPSQIVQQALHLPNAPQIAESADKMILDNHWGMAFYYLDTNKIEMFAFHNSKLSWTYSNGCYENGKFFLIKENNNTLTFMEKE